VLVLLGHAGDWCALVNRSDTDVLAEAFIELAAKYKNIDFILRPHPTMNHPQHEGAGAVERIQAEISQADLPNLSCSQMTLAEDLQVADLTVSEYSATLVDAWRSGRPGLIVNLTKRRSFMEDYERLGFLAVQNRESLAQFFSQLDKSVADLINRQATAVQHYNMLLKNFNTP
jgi:tRNA isopentenyl-2-thiomethyl-A-37 hydroxylase MiaE